jgi:hypothetical protein
VLDAYVEGGPLLEPSWESVNGSRAADPVVSIVEESSMTYADGTYAVCFLPACCSSFPCPFSSFTLMRFKTVCISLA